MSTTIKNPNWVRAISILLILNYAGDFAEGQNNLKTGISSVFITGITYDSKTLEPLASTRFRINNRKGFNISESGSFSFNGSPGDTLYFSYIGYQPTRLIVPDTLKSAEYVMGVFMEPDTVKLAEIIILPRMPLTSIMISPVKTDQKTMDIAQSNVDKAVVEGLTRSPKVYDADMNVKKTMRTNQMRAEYSGMLVTPENSVGISTQSYRNYHILYGSPVISSNTEAKILITSYESDILLEHFEALKRLRQQPEIVTDSIKAP
jgi:hypothetical protein